MRANAGVLGVGIFSLAVLMALFLGILSSILPWWAALALFVPPIVIVAGIRWPAISIVVMLLIAWGFIPLSAMLTDMAVVFFILFITAVHWKRIHIVFGENKTYFTLLFALLLWTFLMAIYGHFYRGNNRMYAFNEAITIIYWTMVLPVMLYASSQKKADIVFNILLGMSLLLSILGLAQSIFSMRLSFSAFGNVTALSGDDGGIPGLARSYTPGVLLVSYFCVYSALKLADSRTSRKLLWVGVLSLNFMGLVVTFGRAQWGMTIAAIVFAAFLAGRKYLSKIVFFGGVSLFLMVVLFLSIDPDIVLGIFDRMLSVRSELDGNNTSLGWRLIENHYAGIAVANNPFVGLGLGAEYKPRLTKDFKEFTEQTFYIHNGYLYIAVKMGSIGLILYLAKYICLISYAKRALVVVEENKKKFYSFIAIFSGVLGLNFVQPEFMAAPSITVLAMLAAVIMVKRNFSTSLIK
jgi:O-antigen ligase